MGRKRRPRRAAFRRPVPAWVPLRHERAPARKTLVVSRHRADADDAANEAGQLTAARSSRLDDALRAAGWPDEGDLRSRDEIQPPVHAAWLVLSPSSRRD